MRSPVFVFAALLAFPAVAAAATFSTPVADGWNLLGKALERPEIPASLRHSQAFKAGIGSVAGMAGPTAIFLSGDPVVLNQKYTRHYDARGQYADMAPQASFIAYGGLQRSVPLQAWRGKHLVLNVRLKDEGGARGYVSLWIGKTNAIALRTAAQVNAPGGDWQAHRFVLDVPQDATRLAITVGLTGSGTVWLEGGSLQPAPPGTPVSWSERLEPNTYPKGDYDNSSTAPPSPGPVRHDEDGVD